MLRREESRLIPFTVVGGSEKQQVVMLADPYNSRMKLQSYTGDPESAASILLQATREHQFSKAIAYTLKKDVAAFRLLQKEGIIPGYFNGDDAFCLVGYTDTKRSIPRDKVLADQILKLAITKANQGRKSVCSYLTRRAKAEDCDELAIFFGSIFQQSYPTPVTEAAYLREAMALGHVFWLVEDQHHIIGAASLDTDNVHGNAEVTDCAVNPQYRGQGLLATLVGCLETEARSIGLPCLFSLTRALLPGINIVLSSLGYRWHGRLINNCQICGDFEDMNIWQKSIRC